VTLDLHYYKVLEALPVLDVFLDEHIAALAEQHTAKKNVFIITGRGIHSSGGKSCIRPVVESRLRKRGLK
jgi:DNA-nicking Smr family endonuclease